MRRRERRNDLYHGRAGLAAIMFFSWLDPGLYADRGNQLEEGLIKFRRFPRR
jgi:hypothetical protein